MRFRTFPVLAVFLLANGCGAQPASQPASGLPTITIQIAGRPFVMEEATNPGQQDLGLGRRDSLPSDHGMIFIYSQPTELKISDTENVRFPLDVIFLDGQDNVCSIQQLKAYGNTPSDMVQGQFILELNQGTAASLGLKIGDHVALPPDTAKAEPVPTLPTTTMQIGGRPFVMEKAVTFDQQRRGLMFRDNLPPDHGMIFIYPSPRSQTFWNHDVHFPLDNVFLDASGTIVSIQQMNAWDDTNTNPVIAQYILELNRGTSDKLGLKVGDRLVVPDDAKMP
ncbi:MAG: DUF192 domain-containing protein [Tepidisphaeraceae bacterium]|jgi:uncharacterized membrane protein (UPF0127 family)